MARSILEVSNLTKRYGEFVAVNNISFSIKEGEIVGLLGPNGAGKTTTTQMLLGMTRPTEGSISYFGKNLFTHREEILEQINYVSAFSGMQTRVTVLENLETYANIYGVRTPKKKIVELVELLGISSKLHELYWHLSSGQRTRVNLVKAFLNNPKLILMDEPTASLDPEIVDTVLDLVASIRKKDNVSILYTSHNMVEVSRICDKVIFLHRGRIIATDTPLGLSRRVGQAVLRLTFDGPVKSVETYLKREKYEYRIVNPHIVEIEIDEVVIPKALFGFAKEKIWITDIQIEKPNLEDVFLAVAKKGAHALASN
jgi:ABC-2 type transport system ATP-binding protein